MVAGKWRLREDVRLERREDEERGTEVEGRVMKRREEAVLMKRSASVKFCVY